MAVKQSHICPSHSTPMKYSRKLRTWYCSECLQRAYESYLAQQEAVKRYRGSEKGKTAQDRYEESEKGQTARQRYLHSNKYKAARRAYNQRLKESLQIARAAKLERPTTERVVERIRTDVLSPLVQEIREYLDVMGRRPSTTEVKEWANDIYETKITTERARELIERASKRR